MNILRVIASMNPESGGPCQGLRNSIPEWESAGHHTKVVCLDHPDSAFIQSDQFKTIALGPAKTSWQYNKQLLPWLIKHLSEYDLVIVHGLWQYHGYAVAKAIRALKKDKQGYPRVFVMPHGMLDPYFQKAEGRRLKAIRNDVYWNLIESRLINSADGILFTCEEELLLARKTFKNYHPKQELNAGYGVKEPPAYDDNMRINFKTKFPAIADRTYILFLSRIHPKKGVDILLKAFEEVFGKDEQQKSPILMVAGPGMDTDFGKGLQSMVDSSDFLKSATLFPGMLAGEDKWAAFYGAEAFILPSHQENFGIAVAEALACAAPVLISNQVNIWREIDKAGAGIVETDDLNGCIQLLQRWKMLNQEHRKTMSDNAKKAFSHYFSVSQAGKQTRQVIGI